MDRDALRDLLTQPLAAARFAAPATSDDAADLAHQDLVPAAVLVPLLHGPSPGVLLTKRASHLRAHAGQVAFPGGRVEPGDVAPGGLPAASVGDQRGAAARRAVTAAAPGRPQRHGSRASVTADDPGFSLVVLAPRDDVDVHAPAPAAGEPADEANPLQGLPNLPIGAPPTE